MLYTALILGLISSLHCIGMCGPIAMMLPVSRNSPERKALQIMAYHLGRIFSYSLIGLLFGIVGRGFYLGGWQQWLSIFAGTAMIVMVLIPVSLFNKYIFAKPVFRFVSKLKNKLGQQFSRSSFRSIFSIGMLNGLLPCGMVYAAVFGALAMTNLVQSVAFMVLFGIGTVPLMSGLIYVQKFFALPFRNKIQKAIPIAVTCIGVLFILRGMGLDIPFISPNTSCLFVKAQPNCH